MSAEVVSATGLLAPILTILGVLLWVSYKVGLDNGWQMGYYESEAQWEAQIEDILVKAAVGSVQKAQETDDTLVH